MSYCLQSASLRRQFAWIVLTIFATLSVSAFGQDGSPTPPTSGAQIDRKKLPDVGEVVAQLDQAIWYVYQAKNNDYWFGGPDRGAYRYDGKTLINFTAKDGLASNHIMGIQEDKEGNIYFATGGGINKFDGNGFTVLRVSATSDPPDWKLQPDDLWFAGPQDSGAIYRFDGESLYRLEFPKTKEGDEHYVQVPRTKYPNAKYSPYDVYRIFKDSGGNIWFGTAILGACRFDGKTFAWLPESELRNGSFGTRSVVEDHEGKFWFCGAFHRYAVDLSDPTEPRFEKEEGIRDANDPNKAPFGGIMSSVLDQNGTLWMATYGQGVWRYDGTSATHYPVTDDGKAITLFSIYQDRQGVLWLGTQSAGAYRFNGKAFEKFQP